MNKRTKALVTAVLIISGSSLFAAEKIMFKWKDSNGEVHYTERAPKGIEYTRIKTYVDSSAAISSPSPEKPAQKEAAESKNAYGTWKDENCTLAKQNLDMLTTASRIGVDDGQGGTRLMSEEEKKAKIAQMEEQRDKYCNAGEENK